MDKRGSIVLVGVLVALALATATSLYMSSDDSVTGSLIGIETISGECNISVWESVLNIGHDYECQNTNGFIIKTDNITFDCQDHNITCTEGCNATSQTYGILLNNHTNVTIQNCHIYNFTDGIRIAQGANRNKLLQNYLYDNTHGVNIYTGTKNNLTKNTFDNNDACGVNISGMDNVGDVANGATFNRIWNNKIFSGTGTNEACNDADSFNHWFLEKTCPGTTYNDTDTYSSANINTTSFRGGPCLGGNWWEDYDGLDVIGGDGLGDTMTPYQGGGIFSDDGNKIYGDDHPLTDPCANMPGLIGEDTECGNKTINSSSGEGYAIINSDVTFTCDGTVLNGNSSNQSPAWQGDMRGIEIKNVHDVTIIGCELYNFTYGVYIENAYNVNLINLTVRENNETGIYIGSLAYNVTVNGNTIGNTNSQLQKYGVDMRSSKPTVGGNNMVVSNTIRNNTYYGILLRDSSDINTISSNQIYWNGANLSSNAGAGIFINDSEGNNIYNNEISENNGSGIRAETAVLSDLGSTASASSCGDACEPDYNSCLGSCNSNLGSCEGDCDSDYTSCDSACSGNLTSCNSTCTSNYQTNLTTCTNTFNTCYDVTCPMSYPDANQTTELTACQNNCTLSYSSCNTTADSDYSSCQTTCDSSYGSSCASSCSSTNISCYSTCDSSYGSSCTSSCLNTYTSCPASCEGYSTNTIYGNYYGYYLDGVSSDSQNGITGNIYNNTYGIYMDYSDPNIRYATLTNNTNTGIYLSDSDYVYLDISNITGSVIGVHVNNSLNFTVADVGDVDISGNTIGIKLENSNNSTLEPVGTELTIHNNTNTNILLDNSYYNSFKYLTIYGGNEGFHFTGSEENSVSVCNITQHTNYGFYLTSTADNNTIFNNYISNTSTGVDAWDNGTNNWNIAKNCSLGLNIMGGACWGGNYWGNYTGVDTDSDGLGNTNIPYQGSGGNITNGGDSYPLVSSNITCGEVTSSFGMTANISNNGTCFTIGADNITFNCNNYTIIGNGSGYGVFLSGRSGVTIENCHVTNFSNGIYLNRTNSSFLTSNTVYENLFHGIDLYGVSNNTLTSNIVHNNLDGVVLNQSENNTLISNKVHDNDVHGFYFDDSNNNTFHTNTLLDNTHGINLTNTSHNNSIYNNLFKNTVHIQDDGTGNTYNTTYNTSELGTNLVGGENWGGNLWSDYTGLDDGNGTTHPYNISGDGIGDSANYTIYNSTDNMITYDYLPLVPSCGNVSYNLILTQNLTVNGTCFIVTADNIEIDCQGYSVTGNTSGRGIDITNKEGVTITNCNLINFTTGIYVDPSSSIIINNTNISLADEGIYFLETSESTISNTRLYDNVVGLTLSGSHNNTIHTNYVYDNTQQGAEISTSSDNLIYNNNFTNTLNVVADAYCNNSWNSTYHNTTTNIAGGEYWGGNYWSDYAGIDAGFGITHPYNVSGDNVGDTQIPYAQNISIGGDYLPLTSNNGTLTGNCPITITEDTTLGSKVDDCVGDALIIAVDDIILDCNNNVIYGDGTGAGININGKENIIIKNCNVTGFYYGVEILHSENIQINSSNYIYNNDFYAIYQFNSTNTKVINNELTNDNNGIYSISSTGTIIKDNVINLQKKFYGIYSFNSPNNLIENNTMYDNYHGIYLVNSDNTNVTGNNISASDVYSLFIHKGTDGSRFINNTLATALEGIRIKQSSINNYFYNNTVEDHTNYGLRSTDSSGNEFVENTFTNNTGSYYNIYLEGSSSNSFTNNTITNSTIGTVVIDSDSLLLLNNTINSSTAPCLLVNSSSSINLTENTLQNQVVLNTVPSSTLYNNTVIENLTVTDSSDVLAISYNNITNVLNITDSDSVTLDNNNLVDVYITNTDGSAVESNVLKKLILSDFDQLGVTKGVVYNNDVDDVDGTAFNFSDVDNTLIHGNNIQNATVAILLHGSSNYNSIYDNWVKDNGFGLNITNSVTNTIYNNYFENTNHDNVADDSSNTWYTTYSCSTPNIVGGPCQGGNFYSDYYGLDNGVDDTEQGDGIGDQPNYYTISTGNTDPLPLVLYVSRQYFAPTTSQAVNLTAQGNISGELSDEEVVPNEIQTINYSTGGNYYLEFVGYFNQSDVHAEELTIMYDDNKTAINKSGVTGEAGAYAIYLYHHDEFDAGVYVCEEQYNLSLDETCTPQTNLTSIGAGGNGMILSQSGSYYKISNITNQTITAGVNKNGYCEGNILHDVTLTENVSCNGTAFIVTADNITIDFAGYSLIGNGSGIGINISNYDGVTIKDAVISNFSTAIYADPAENLNITDSKISGSSIGISFSEINNSFVTHNFIWNNSVGLNLSSSYNNTIYNNYFNNTLNAVDDGNNTYNLSNVTGTNILNSSVSYFNITNATYNYSVYGGNYWSDYSGWDIDLDGLGETLLPWNGTGNITTGGDSMPLTDVGKIACGGSTQTVTTNITLNRNLTTTGTCFTIGADNVTLDCAGYTLSGNGSGEGINLSERQGVNVQNCGMSNFSKGINLISNSMNNTFTSNIVYENNYGVYIGNSMNNTFTSNIVYNNDDKGIYLYEGSDNNTLTSNEVYNNGDGGFSLISNENNTLTSNSVYNNAGFGIYLDGVNFTTIHTNTITNNTLGINLTDSDNNTLYNNYFNNTNNAVDSGSNYWNTTYNCSVANYTNIVGGNCTGGNYWSNYAGNDTSNGTAPYDSHPWNITGDEIGNTLIPYNNSDNITTGGDYLPLMFVSSGSEEEEISGCDPACSAGYHCSSGTCVADSSSSGGCFLAGTQITTLNGEIAINKLKVGDKVVSYDLETRQQVTSTVSKLYEIERTNYYLLNQNIKVTGEHPFYVGGTWKPVEELRIGDLLFNGETTYKLNSIKQINQPVTVYNLFVDKHHNYFAEGILVHNKGGSSSSSTTTPEVNCTQSWTCGTWGDCINGQQTRNCNDMNLCESKKSAWEVDNVITTPKPAETRNCDIPVELEEPQLPTPPAEEKPHIIDKIIPPEGPARVITLSALASLLMMGGIYASWYFGSGANRLRRRFKKLPSINKASTTLLKSEYMGIYGLYTKLSEKHKKNFYSKVTKLRETIETQLKSEKIIEQLMLDKDMGDLADQKKTYLEIYKYYQKLSPQVQKKYYQNIVLLREKLEKGI